MPFTPRQLEGLQGGWVVTWNNHNGYNLRLPRRVTGKFLGFLWLCDYTRYDDYFYPATVELRGNHCHPAPLVADLKFLEEYIANLWKPKLEKT